MAETERRIRLFDAKAGADAVSRSVAAAARTGQTIGIEWMDYLKQAGTDAAAAAQKMMRAGSPAGAIEIQRAFATSAGEQWLARAATLRDLYATLARDMADPFAALPRRGGA